MTETQIPRIPNSSGELRLRPYQTEGLSFLLNHRRGILALDPGTGKTPTSLIGLRDAGARRILIVAPKSVCLHWEDLAAQWWPRLWVVVGTGTARQREKARSVFAAEAEDGPVALILNYEAMRADVDELAGLGFDAVTFDEAHRLKNARAQQTRAANVLCRSPHMWVWLVTGTPILNRPEEIWSLLHLIDRHRWSSYWNWVRAYYETTIETYGWGASRRPVEQLGNLREGALEKMRAQLVDVMFHRSLEQCLPDLPEVTYSTVTVTLDAEERRVYTELKKRVWARIDENTIVTVPNEVARMTRLRQVVSDVEILGATRDKPGSKIAAAVELIADLEPEQVVVLTWSREAAERIVNEVDRADYIHGGVGQVQRQATLEAFKAGRVRVLAGTIATIGEGVDGLQVARHMIRLDRDWTPARNEQAVARLRRSGQNRAVVVHDIVAHDTVDAVVERALRRKEDVIAAVLENLG